MATSATMRIRMSLKKIAKALRSFVAEQGWQPDDCQIFFRVVEDWGRINILFIVKSFGGLSEQDMWSRVWDHLQKTLMAAGEIGFSVGLSVRSQQQVDQGGMYSIPDGYVEEELLFGSGVGD